MLDQYRSAGEWAGSVFAGVRPDQYGDATGCDEWDVRALMNHVIGGNQMFAEAVRGADAPDQERLLAYLGRQP